MPNPINALVLGYGFSAKIFHIPFLTTTAGIRLHSILQRPPTSASASWAKDDYGGTNVTVFSSWEEVESYQRSAADEARKIHLLVVTAGNQAHAELVRKGLEAGLHVVVEKPFAPTAKECDELVALAGEVGRVLTVYHNRRFDSDFLTLTNLLATNTLPSPTYIRSCFNRHVPATATPPAKPWKRPPTLGNGVLYDLGSHLIDQALHLFRTTLSSHATSPRGLPTRLLGTLHDERGTALPMSRDPAGWGATWVDDGFDVLMEYDHPQGGAKTTVHLTATSASPRAPQERWVVRGGGGRGWVKFGMDSQEDQLISSSSYPGIPGYGEEEEGEWGELTTVGGGGDKGVERRRVKGVKGDYGLFYGGVIRAVNGEGNGEGVVRAEEAADVLRVIEAVGRSAREGRWVEVV